MKATISINFLDTNSVYTENPLQLKHWYITPSAIPCITDYQYELNTIQYLAEANRHNEPIINKLLSKTQNKQQQRQKQKIHNTHTYQ